MINKVKLHIMDFAKTEERYKEILNIIERMQDDNTHPSFIIGMLEMLKLEVINSYTHEE